MRVLIVSLIAATFVATAQPPHLPRPQDPLQQDDTKMPNGKSQREEILKADYQKSLQDARELSRLADELKLELEKSDRNVLSIPLLKKTEEIEKLAKRLRDRLKH